jgi:hypothetical protein
MRMRYMTVSCEETRRVPLSQRPNAREPCADSSNAALGGKAPGEICPRGRYMQG